MKNNLLNVLDQLATHEPSEFLAPVPDVQQVVLFTLQDNIPYRFKVRSFNPAGWHYFKPNTRNGTATSLRDGQPVEIIDYLTQLRGIYVIAVFRVSETSWMVIPNNISDAHQRGWRYGAPRVMHLVNEAIQPFDVMVARSMGGTLLYDTLTERFDPSEADELREQLTRGSPVPLRLRPELMLAYRLMTDHQTELRRLDEERILAARAAMLKERQNQEVAKAALRRAEWETHAREALGFMGAQMVNWNGVTKDSFNVTWEYQGRRATTRIDRNLTVLSAGFCLAGTDSQHTLTDIVKVMLDAVSAKRPDLPASFRKAEDRNAPMVDRGDDGHNDDFDDDYGDNDD